MSTSYPGEYYPPEMGDLIPDDDNEVEDDDGEDSPDFTPDDGINRPDLPDVGDPDLPNNAVGTEVVEESSDAPIEGTD